MLLRGEQGGVDFGPCLVRGVDEAHCCDTSRSLRILIGQHCKATSSKEGATRTCKLTFVQNGYVQYNYQLNLLVFLISYGISGL